MAKRKHKTPPLVWHYTTGIHFERIADMGVILTEADTTPDMIRPGTLAAVWFSANQWWEPTASKCLRPAGRLPRPGEFKRFTKQETAEMCGGLVRIGIRLDDHLIPWHVFRHISGLPKSHLDGMAKAGKAQGADTRQWYASPRPVPLDQWQAVDVWADGKWEHVRMPAPKTSAANRSSRQT